MALPAASASTCRINSLSPKGIAVRRIYFADAESDLAAGGTEGIGLDASGNLTIDAAANIVLTATTGVIAADSVVKLRAAGGADAAGALLMGVGTSGSPATTAVASKNMVEIRSETTATSGDFRNIYLRTDFNGAGVAGEGLRSNTVINAAVAGTVNGAHLSSEVKTGGGSVTGMATGARLGFIVPDAALSGGTVYGGLSEIYSAGSSSDVSGATLHAIHSFQASGDATGAANVDNALHFAGTDGTGEMLYDHVVTTPGAAGGSIQINVNGATGFLYWWDTEGAT